MLQMTEDWESILSSITICLPCLYAVHPTFAPGQRQIIIVDGSFAWFDALLFSAVMVNVPVQRTWCFTVNIWISFLHSDYQLTQLHKLTQPNSRGMLSAVWVPERFSAARMFRDVQLLDFSKAYLIYVNRLFTMSNVAKFSRLLALSSIKLGGQIHKIHYQGREQ